MTQFIASKIGLFLARTTFKGEKSLDTGEREKKNQLLKEVKGPRPPIYPYLVQRVSILFEGAFQFPLPEFSRDIYVFEKNTEKFRENGDELRKQLLLQKEFQLI